MCGVPVVPFLCLCYFGVVLWKLGEYLLLQRSSSLCLQVFSWTWLVKQAVISFSLSVCSAHPTMHMEQGASLPGEFNQILYLYLKLRFWVLPRSVIVNKCIKGADMQNNRRGQTFSKFLLSPFQYPEHNICYICAKVYGDLVEHLVWFWETSHRSSPLLQSMNSNSLMLRALLEQIGCAKGHLDCI